MSKGISDLEVFLFEKEFLLRSLYFKRNSYSEASILIGIPTWKPLFEKEFLPGTLYVKKEFLPRSLYLKRNSYLEVYILQGIPT